MIKTKKRLSDNRGDGPIKKKSQKLELDKGKNKPPKTDGSSKANKFAKTSQRNAIGKMVKDKFAPKSLGKPGAGQPRGLDKFGKNGKKPGLKGAAPGEGEKTDWRKFKQEKKELKLKRKQAKDSYEVSVEAKQIYEKLKCRRTENKSELVEKLYNVLNRGDVIKKLIMAHDTARIIQCMLKYASPAIRDQISEKLLPLAVEMSVSKYSHFCVLRMFKYGSPTIKSKLVDSFMGNVVRLAGHNISSKILDHVYHAVANPKQRGYLRQEFYGELYRSSKDDNVKTLADTYKNTLNMKRSILGAVKSNLDHLANKQLVDNSLVHAVILEYLGECEDDKIEETVSSFAPLIPLMLTTKDGTQSATICFYKSTPKNRRAIIKTIKEHLVNICTHEHGHIFLLALVNSLDDTKATKKAIYDTLHPELETLMANQWGRRVIEWLVAPADTNCFHPSFIANIEDGLQYGKKDKDIRRKEIFEQIEESLANAIADNAKFWLSNRHIGLVTAEILKKLSQEHFEKATSAIADVIVDPSWAVTVEEEPKIKNKKIVHDVEKIISDATKAKKQKRLEPSFEENKQNDSTDDEVDKKKEKEAVTIPGIEESGLHIVLKKIIKNDKERLTQNSEAQTFGSILVQKLNEETLKNWVNVNRACFILLNTFEQNTESTKSILKDLLKPLHQVLKEGTGAGQKLLLNKMEF
ncbi:PREDICTED: protein penguin-like isoform X2 [Rhagoletis zephyria]|uniref:protein penguin-like isoform X2 n=1 Tax=Rhagoletis zephyria TaxID=28612 RepID=UPI0008114CE7|nr:PREDICTED: protein penguin-like isoform X2 [Rhagoletis zephyria]